MRESTNTENPQPTPADLQRMIIASCAIVAIAYWLGASWLRQPVLGLPTGIYAIAVIFAALRWGGFRPFGARASIKDDIKRIARQAAAANAAAVRLVRRKCADGLNAAANAIDAEESTARVDEESAPSLKQTGGPITVGANLAPDRARRLLSVSGDRNQLRVRMLTAGESVADRLNQLGLDALIHEAPEGVAIRLPNAQGIHTPGTASYPWVFPASVTSDRYSLEGIDLQNAHEAGFVVEFAAFAAAFNRFGAHDPRTCEFADAFTGAVRRALAAGTSGATINDAVNLLSVWTAAPGPLEQAPVRARAAETSVALLSESPAVVLRRAALRISETEDASEELDRATSEFTSRFGEPSAAAFLPFLEAELNLVDASDDFLVGRVAAAASILMRRESGDALAEDLIDEIKRAPALIEREQDAAMLISMIRRAQQHAAEAQSIRGLDNPQQFSSAA